MAVFKNSETGHYYVYHNDVEGGRELDRGRCEIGEAPPIIDLINNYWLNGYNNIGYDNIILTAMIRNPNPRAVKLRNDMLFKHMKENDLFNRTKRHNQRRKFTDNKRFPVSRAIKSIDSMQEIIADEHKDDMMGISLKYIEGNRGVSIFETSVSFDIQRPLTEQEVKDTILYCMNDVDETELIMFARWEDYFEPKMFLCDMIEDWGFEFCMSMRTTTLTGKLLENDNKTDFFKVLESLKDKMTPEMYAYWKKGYNPDDKDDDGLVLEQFENIIKYKWGGIHAVHRLKKYFEGRIWHIDVASMYPSIIVLLMLLGEEKTKLYDGLRVSRVDDKHHGRKKAANGKKLILNKLYGILGSKTSKVSNIGGMNSICVYGQVAMYNIGKLVSPYGTIIQFNTDGIYFQPNDDIELDFIKEVLKEWEDEFKLELDIEEFVSIAQRDVNTYVAVKDDGSFKTKGEISSYEDKWSNMFKSWNASIVEKAVVDLITKDIPIVDTVNKEEEMKRFQYVTKNSKAFRGLLDLSTGEEVEHKVNRFVIVNSGGRTYKKVKPTKIETFIKRQDKLKSKIAELESQMPEYLADKAVAKTKKELAKKWKTGPEKKLENARNSLITVEETISRIERGDDVVTYEKVTGMPEVGDKTLLVNHDINEDTQLAFRIDRKYYIDAARDLAGAFGV